MSREINTTATFWVVRVLGMVLMLLLLARLASAQSPAENRNESVPQAVDNLAPPASEPKLDVAQPEPQVTPEPAATQPAQMFFTPEHPGNKTDEEAKQQAEQNREQESAKKEEQVPPE